LRHALKPFLSSRAVAAVQVVIGGPDRSAYEAATADLEGVLPPVEGGVTRQESVLRGLEALAAHAPRLVLVHDAARPFASGALIERVIAACDDTHGAIPVIPVVETLKTVSDGLVAATVPREQLAAAQTPQGFPFASLLAAHRAAAAAGRNDLTDDASVVWLTGMPVRVVAGERGNVKITSAEDFVEGERRLADLRETRSAQGFDVHAFGPGDRVRLCGVDIPHRRALIGHSDADVGLHALTDALLGTIGAGDIGSYFPPGDPQWRGAASDRFLNYASMLLAGQGGRIVNLDVTLVCEEPKISPHRDAMRAAIAAIVGIKQTRVSVKATTSEGLGFAGRGEGIAALAVATVTLPAGR
jgi:2-C-methyl-D-erythritol 4-phosphate cytidylyltransferase/2-C-methyl-D-erythritol 2,4-cyclodiphosphate synthase